MRRVKHFSLFLILTYIKSGSSHQLLVTFKVLWQLSDFPEALHC